MMIWSIRAGGEMAVEGATTTQGEYVFTPGLGAGFSRYIDYKEKITDRIGA